MASDTEPTIEPLYKLVQVPYYILADRWKEDGIDSDRIAFVLEGGNTLEEHLIFREDMIRRLLERHDDEHTSWVSTSRKTEEFTGIIKFASVFCFRVRDTG